MVSATFQFDQERHEYTDLRDGARVVSVTQVLNGVGLVDYSRIPESILSHKAEIGTAAHAACHFFDESDLEWSTVDLEVEPYVRAWEKFRRETDFEPRLIEHRGISEIDGMRYGFTVDREGLFNGRPTVCELKCTAGEEISWPIQLAAYELALRKLDGTARARLVIHLRPNGCYSLINFTDIKDYQIWKCALSLEWWKRNKGKVDGYGSKNIVRSH